MPTNRKIPSYRLHKASNRGVVTLGGRDYFLGHYGTPESRQRYDRLVREWLARGRQSPAPAPQDLTVVELIARYWAHAESHYRLPDGSEAGELDNIRRALRPLKALYGATPAIAFGPLSLRAVRQRMVELGWCRTAINRQTLRVKAVFRWAASNELLPASVYESLRTVEGLRAGRSDARESAPVKPVAESHAAAILDFLSPQVQAMVELQAITGMRSGEVISMRGCDIDTTAKPWKYRPAAHKTAHHGHDRVIDLGPQCRSIIEPFLKPDVNAYLFSPSEAVAACRAVRHAERQTPMSCGNVPGSNRVRRPARRPGDRYEVAAYRRAIQRTCDRAFPPPADLARHGKETRRQWHARLTPAQRIELAAWRKAHKFHPHQLRHTAATRWRAQFGAEATLVLLGDRTTRMVDLYAEKDRKAAASIMESIG